MQQQEILVRKPTEGEIEYISKEITWSSEPCEFDYYYDHNETALVIYGRATIRYQGGEVTVGPGDLFFTPKGLQTHWIVRESIKKYEF
jgi:uncharacterized cupin superfamily protein